MKMESQENPCAKCDIPGHEWSSKTGWGER